MYNFGKVFKEIRKTKKLTLDEVANGDFSVSMLSKFENGKTQISLQKLNKALSNMRVTIEEFYHFSRDLKYDDNIQLIIDIEKLYNNKNLDGLKSLYQNEINLSKINKYGKYNILNSILIASKIKTLEDTFEIEENHKKILHDYLFGIEIWGEYEMLLMINSIEFTNAKVYLNYAKDMIKKVDYFKDRGNMLNLMQTAMIHGVSICIEQDYSFGASYFLKKSKEYIEGSRDVYMFIIYTYIEGYYLTYIGNIKDGKNKVFEAIDLLKRVGKLNSAKYYENEYHKYIEKLKLED